jgi:hypothetical protein
MIKITGRISRLQKYKNKWNFESLLFRKPANQPIIKLYRYSKQKRKTPALRKTSLNGAFVNLMPSVIGINAIPSMQFIIIMDKT